MPGQSACPDVDSLTGDAALPFQAVRYLADDALEGRLAGSRGARCAARFIAGQFRMLGLRPAGDDGGYFQSLPLASAVTPHAPGGTGRNVVAILPGSDAALAGEAVVVGAHFDHLGRGPFGSLAPEDSGQVHNGADDNASGVAALLLVARELSGTPHPARSVIFAAFTGEELGLLGSSFYVEHPVVPAESTTAMVNMDMVGRLGQAPLIVYGLGTAPEWSGILDDAVRGTGLTLAYQDAGYGPSDQTSFYAHGIPVLHFFTNVHGDYHRPTDDWQKIDEGGIRRVAGLVARIVRSVANGPAPLTYLAGAGKPPSEEKGGYGSYLGTVPDFAPVPRGVRLSAVTAGSPADRAGLRGGDVIVGFEGDSIADLYALTDALRSHPPGDTVRVTVLREGRERTFTAVLGSRSDR